MKSITFLVTMLALLSIIAAQSLLVSERAETTSFGHYNYGSSSTTLVILESSMTTLTFQGGSLQTRTLYHTTTTVSVSSINPVEDTITHTSTHTFTLSSSSTLVSLTNSSPTPSSSTTSKTSITSAMSKPTSSETQTSPSPITPPSSTAPPSSTTTPSSTTSPTSTSSGGAKPAKSKSCHGMFIAVGIIVPTMGAGIAFMVFRCRRRRRHNRKRSPSGPLPIDPYIPVTMSDGRKISRPTAPTDLRDIQEEYNKQHEKDGFDRQVKRGSQTAQNALYSSEYTGDGKIIFHQGGMQDEGETRWPEFAAASRWGEARASMEMKETGKPPQRPPRPASLWTRNSVVKEKPGGKSDRKETPPRIPAPSEFPYTPSMYSNTPPTTAPRNLPPQTPPPRRSGPRPPRNPAPSPAPIRRAASPSWLGPPLHRPSNPG